MLETIRILNFDESVTRQKNVMGNFRPMVVDLAHLGSTCRISMDDQAANEIRCTLSPELKSAITLLGSGDFHHVSSLLIQQFDEPIGVIVFDHHPDWDILPPKLHCGSWVTNVLKMKPNVKKLILLGVSSEDISSPWIQTGNLQALADDRVEIYPYWHKPTRTILRDVPDNRSIHTRKGMLSNTIYWQELGKIDLEEFFLQMLRTHLPKQVYVSLDKDCLRASHSLTNWEEGHLSLEELLRLLQLINAHFEIVGLDIVGDYSPPVVNGWWKAAWAAIDRPRDYSAKGKSLSLINEINEDTNMRILESLIQQFAPHEKLRV